MGKASTVDLLEVLFAVDIVAVNRICNGALSLIAEGATEKVFSIFHAADIKSQQLLQFSYLSIKLQKPLNQFHYLFNFVVCSVYLFSASL
jgi:hypothetical protein